MKGKKEETVSVFDRWLTSRLENIHTAIPAKIVKYNGHNKRTAKVQPLLKLKNQYGVVSNISPIDDVPVQFPSGASLSILWEPEKDDGCLLVFSESDISNFVNGDGKEVNEVLTHNRFKLGDAICLLGVHSPKNVPESTNTIKAEGSTITINSFESDV